MRVQLEGLDARLGEINCVCVCIHVLVKSTGFAMLRFGCSTTTTNVCASKAVTAGKPTGCGLPTRGAPEQEPPAAAGPRREPLRCCRCAQAPLSSLPGAGGGKPAPLSFPLRCSPAWPSGRQEGDGEGSGLDAARQPRREGRVFWQQSAAVSGCRRGRALGVALQGVAFRAALIRRCSFSYQQT